jgi:DnaJ-class molecular chaperone
MKLVTVRELLSDSEKAKPCQQCDGKGWKWSDLDFGDLPGDERRISCPMCAGTGKIKIVTVRADIIVPYDMTIIQALNWKLGS